MIGCRSRCNYIQKRISKWLKQVIYKFQTVIRLRAFKSLEGFKKLIEQSKMAKKMLKKCGKFSQTYGYGNANR